MEGSAVSGSKLTDDGARFRISRPSYQQMLDYSEIRFDMFTVHDEAFFCFCGR